MISKVDRSNLEEAISLVTRINQDLAHKISYFGETRAEITADFCAVQPPEGYGVIATKDNGEIVGFFGIEMDLGLGRSWLFGPLVEEGDWDVLADRLYQAISADLPPEIADQELYFPSQNLRLQGFALRHGFEFHAEGTVLVLDVKQRRLRDAAGVIEFDEKYSAQLDALHDQLFPKTYYSAEQLIQLARDEDKYLLIKLEDENLAGYIFIQLRPASQDVYIDFLGVDELHRRQGIAQDLVSTAVDWAVQNPCVESITLTVNGDNEAAVSLYHSLGFTTQSVSRGYRKSLSGVNSG
jgi:ribosomal protein S18 acetylase RimI-like enzyme